MGNESLSYRYKLETFGSALYALHNEKHDIAEAE